jgi:tRNA (guanine26-N2/guanine27-N2)-dimethyltransferase
MVAMRAASLEMSVRPVFSHAASQYVRAYLVVERSATKADETLERLGYLIYCDNCLFRGHYNIGDTSVCPSCGFKTRIMGPLWIAEIVDKNLAKTMLDESKRRGWKTYSRSLNRLVGEVSDPPFYYSITALSEKLGLSMPSPENVVDKLREVGFSASRSWLEPQAVRTNAPINVIKDAIRELASRRSS